jgi:uncharacterized protein (TIGR00255 family)
VDARSTTRTLRTSHDAQHDRLRPRSRHIEVGELTWELRSVNHRFLEPTCACRKSCAGSSPKVRERLSARLGRGKVDCTLRFAPRPGARRLAQRQPTPHGAGAEVVADEIATRIGEPATPHVFELLQWPGLLQEPERDMDAVASAALALLERALDTLVAPASARASACEP